MHFEHALAANTRMGARPWLAHAEHDYARMLYARNARGDHTRAQELLDAARTTYRHLGMKNHAAATAMVAHKAGTTR